MTDVTLYGFPMSNYVRTARLALEEKGVAYELTPLDFGSEALLAEHPFGKIPAFTHGDFRLYETSAICRYVDEAFDGPALQPADLRGRAVMEQWISAINSYYDTDLIRAVVIQRVLVPLRGGEPDEAKIAAALPRIETEMKLLDARLGEAAYLAGDAISIADFFLSPMIAYFRNLAEGEAALAGHDNIARWWDAISTRPSFIETTPPPRVK